MARDSNRPNFPLRTLPWDVFPRHRNCSLEAGALRLESLDSWLQPRVLRVSLGRPRPSSIRSRASGGFALPAFSAMSRVTAPGSPLDRGRWSNVFDRRPHRRWVRRSEPRLPGLPKGTERRRPSGTTGWRKSMHFSLGFILCGIRLWVMLNTPKVPMRWRDGFGSAGVPPAPCFF